MTSKAADAPKAAFVWIWLPGTTRPVVAGRIDLDNGMHGFTYGRSYLARKDAIPVYLPELPLQRGAIAPVACAMARPTPGGGASSL